MTRETDREALIALYHATGGSNWIRNNNWLSDVPISERDAVTTDDNYRVTELSLDQNQLSGGAGQSGNDISLDSTNSDARGITEGAPWHVQRHGGRRREETLL